MQDAAHQSADPDASIDHDLSQDDIAMQTQPSTKAFGGAHSVRPVTLRQVLDAKPDLSDKKAWKLHDREIDNITVVATVIQETIKEDECRAWYKVIDGTSHDCVTVFRYFDRAVDRILPVEDSRVATVPRHVYVRIVGRLGASSRGYGNNITADAVNVVEDPNEVFYHALNVFYTELLLQKGLPPKNVLQSLPQEVQNISGREVVSELPATQDVSFAISVPSTPVTRPAQPPKTFTTKTQTVQDVRPPANLSYTPTRPAKPLQTPKKPKAESITPQRVSPARRHAEEEPAEPASPKKYIAIESQSPVAGPSTPRRARAPSPPSPPVSPSPSPEKPKWKGKGRAVPVIKPDPLSHLTALQRKILLCIMDKQTVTECVNISDIGDCIFMEDLTVELDDIGDALKFLSVNDYIVDVGEPEGCVFRAVEQDDVYMGYGSIHD